MKIHPHFRPSSDTGFTDLGALGVNGVADRLDRWTVRGVPSAEGRS